MKKFLFLLMSVAVLSASAGITKSHVQKKIATFSKKAKIEQVTRTNSLVAPSTPIPFNGWDNFASHMLRSDQAITWDFEEEADFNEFQALDSDGDGFNWQYFNMTGVETGRMTPHEGEGLVASASYDKTTQAALTPDNWLISPEVTLGGTLSFWAEGQDASYAAEVFAVYVCVGTPNGTTNFVKVSEDYTATGSYVEYEIDLSAYQGQVGHFAIRHYNVTDMFWLNIDDITLDAGAVYVPKPVVPVVTVTPAATSAYVAWPADEYADGFDLRYRPYVDITGNVIDCDLPLDGYEDQLDDWFIYDADGDGENWTLNYSSDAEDDVCWFSYSYNGSNLSPDNWLITRDLKLQGELRFTLWGQSNSWPDVMNVFAFVYNDEAEDGYDVYQLFEEDLQTTTTHTTYNVDLSVFNGALGFIVFRHYNCTGQWYLYLDDIFIGDANYPQYEQPDWIYPIQGAYTDPYYTIENLTPETTYEVEVMAYQGDYDTDWSNTVYFTTLSALRDVYMLGGDDQAWNPTEGVKFNYNEEDNIYTLNYTFEAENNYFGFTTELAENNDDGGWAYIEPFRFGAIADEGTDYWYTGEEDFISLTWDAYHAIRIPAGEYNMTIDLEAMRLIIEPVTPAGLRGDVNLDEKVSIADVTALIDYLLSGDPTGISVENANCNLDDKVSIADVTALIDYLLSGQW